MSALKGYLAAGRMNVGLFMKSPPSGLEEKKADRVFF